MGRKVRVKGDVTSALKIPIVATKLYALRDETGEITVVTSGSVPGIGARVRVEGVLENVAVVGTATVGLHISETRRW